MPISDVNLLAVLLAAVASWLVGAAWYMALSKPWLRAARIDPALIKPNPWVFFLSFVAELVMAAVFALLLAHFPDFGLGDALASGFFLWLGFVAVPVVVNSRYQGFGWDLPLIDGGHWLAVLLVQAAVIALMG